QPIAITAVFLPLLPSLVIDAMLGFPNILEIIQQPRAHPMYVPNMPFGNTSLLPLIFGWSRELSGPLSTALSTFTTLLIGLGIAIGIGSVAQTTRVARMTPALAATVLFCVAAFELTVLGMGYNTRHTLAMVPPLFILAGFGFAGVVNLVAPAKHSPRPCLTLPLLT